MEKERKITNKQEVKKAELMKMKGLYNGVHEWVKTSCLVIRL
jgi:hypothetical protein